jgi:virginiamycin B lyase
LLARIVSVAITGLALLAAGCSSSGSATAVLPAGDAGLSRSLLPPASDPVIIRQFYDLPQYSGLYGPSAIAQTAGSIWVADDIDQDYGQCVVVKIGRSGKALKDFYYPGRSTQGASFQDMAVGSDGALWITDIYNEQIVRMTTQGTYTNFPLHYYSAPYGITGGPDKALWFTFASGSKGPGIGRITTSGRIKIYSASSGTQDITAGPDGALWFTEPGAGRIGRITTHGAITEYSNGITAGSQPYSIAPGPDGALWFTERMGGRIGRITTAGKVTEYSIGITPTEQPFDLAPGPDGAMWFTEYETYGSYEVRAAKIGRITMHGKITEYSRRLNAHAGPTDIVAGPNGRMWFIESNTNRTGRVTL